MDDYLTDNELTTVSETDLNRPDYIGVVSGAQYKLMAAEGVTEFALIFVQDGDTYLYEASEDDLKYLVRQIAALVEWRE